MDVEITEKLFSQDATAEDVTVTVDGSGLHVTRRDGGRSCPLWAVYLLPSIVAAYKRAKEAAEIGP